MPQYSDPMYYSLAVLLVPIITVGLTKYLAKVWHSVVTKAIKLLRSKISY